MDLTSDGVRTSVTQSTSLAFLDWCTNDDKTLFCNFPHVALSREAKFTAKKNLFLPSTHRGKKYAVMYYYTPAPTDRGKSVVETEDLAFSSLSWHGKMRTFLLLFSLSGRSGAKKSSGKLEKQTVHRIRTRDPELGPDATANRRAKRGSRGKASEGLYSAGNR